MKEINVPVVESRLEPRCGVRTNGLLIGGCIYSNMSLSKRGHIQTYDALYECLSILEKQNRALPVYKIHYSPKFHKLLIQKGLIQPSKDEKLSPLYGYKATSKYYIVSQKGKQYMEAYENMKNIIGGGDNIF